MSGRHSRTTSPSSSSTRRSTPCVLGCCGPMFSSMVSSSSCTTSMASLPGSTPSMRRPRSNASDCSSRVGRPGPPGGGRTAISACPRHVARPLRGGQRPLEVVREGDRLAEAHVVLAQRVAHPVLGKEDAVQVVVAGELDAEEVEGLALVPVHAREDALGGGDAGRVLGHLHDQPAVVVVLQRAQLVDDVVARRGRLAVGPVDRGDEQRHAVGGVVVVAEHRQRADEVLDVHEHGHLAGLLLRPDDGVGKLALRAPRRRAARAPDVPKPREPRCWSPPTPEVSWAARRRSSSAA